MDYIAEIHKYGLDKDSYECLLKDIDSKLDGDLDVDWSELRDKYGVDCHPDTIRKASASIFGGKFRSEYLKSQIYTNPDEFSKEQDLDNKLEEIRKERIKLQTANIERNRLDRQEARQEMFYEYVGDVCNTIEPPIFQPLLTRRTENTVEYVLTIADIHYGAVFDSVNNCYSPAIAKHRFEKLTQYVVNFIEEHKINTLHVLQLGDAVQGILRINDLRINDSSVVKAVVEVSKLVASFLNAISAFCKIEYYHVPSANHTQLRYLGTKANELADEDLEYIIGHYIESLCVMNDRIHVNFAEEGSQYLTFDIYDYKIITGHGHTLKGYKNSLRNLSILNDDNYDYCILGHYHGGDMFTSHEGIDSDREVIVAPSFIGSDPYSDSLMRGSKSACLMLGFDKNHGHTETYKFILN